MRRCCQSAAAIEATDAASSTPEIGRVMNSHGFGVGHHRAHQVDLDLVAEDHAEDERRERDSRT